MATTQISQAKQIAIALKTAAKLITTKDREVTRLTAQLEKAQARIEAAKEAKATGKAAPKGPRVAKAKLAQTTKGPRAKKVADDEDDTPVRVKRGPKAAVAEKGVKKVVAKKAVTGKVAAKKATNKVAGKAPMKPNAKAAGKVAKSPVKKSKAGNDDFLLP